MQKLTGIVQKILITPPNEKVSMEVSDVQITFEGLEGDYHSGLTLTTHGRQPEYPKGTEICNLRQITILSAEELAEIATDLQIPELDISWLSGNILVAGTPHLSVLPFGSRFLFSGGVVLLCSGENNPCSTPAKITQFHYPEKTEISREFVKAALHRRGVVAWVEHPGRIMPGESYRIELPAAWDPFWVEHEAG